MNSGITYFPLDVHLDDKFDLIEAEFGLTGFAVVVKLLQRIYGGQGYYCEWTKDVALLFGKNLGFKPGDNVVSEIVEASIRRGIFDRNLYEKYQILTSRGIQKRYFEAVSRRVKVEVKAEYLLVQVEQNYKNVYIFKENVDISSENANISEQRKVEKSKVKKRKVKETEAADVPQDLIDCYQNNISRNFITSIELDNLAFWCEKVEPAVIEWAIGEAVSHNVRTWSYIKRILENHFNAGRTTLAAVKSASRNYSTEKEFDVYHSDTDHEAIEKIR